MADSHIYANTALFYMPFDDGVGKAFRSLISPSLYYNYTDTNDFMVWVQTPALLILCKDASHSYQLNKCCQKESRSIFYRQNCA